MYFAYKYGILGIRLKFEKERLDSTLKAMTSGTAIMNHSIKNEILKMSMCMKNIRNSVHKTNIDINDVDENIQTVLDATDHLTAMMKRIQNQMKEIILIESSVDLAEIVDKSIEMQKYCLENVIVVKNYRQGFIVKCDPIHITEVLNNVIKNAVEAISENGILEISIYSKRTKVVIEVKDNGIGISKENIKYVFDPFYSTKHMKMNFGLGISYSYNVMQHHQGNLEIQSKENVGTIVSLIFPKERILTVSRA
jgi:two-component system sporulation sensor kinase B